MTSDFAGSKSRETSTLHEALQAVRDARARMEELESARHEPIAIVGIGCRLPGGANSPDAFWQLLCDGVDAVGTVPPSRWDPAAFAGSAHVTGASLEHGAFLADIDMFDPYFFGIAPKEAARMDPQQRLLLEVAWEALEDAGLTREAIRGGQVGVFVGANSTEYLHMQLADPADIDMYTIMGGTGSAIANRLSYLLDLRGPSLVVDSACSSSLVALHLACQSLRQRECSTAIVGGVQLILSPAVSFAYAKGQVLAPDGRCKTFDAAADGFVRAEGAGVVVCKRLTDAVAAGDRVWAVVRGTAVNQDGRTNGIWAPSGLAQQAMITQALRAARIPASQVTMVEAHGTGTVLGDPIEVEALAEIYGGDADDACALGSVKTNIGHLEPAAGIVSLIKSALSIRYRVIPPSIHIDRLNPHISLESTRLYIPTRTTPWELPDERRHAAVSAFGAGGTNAHAVLGPAPKATPDATLRPGPYVISITAAGSAALGSMAAAYRDHLRTTDNAPASLADIAYSANNRRTQHDHRLTVVAGSPAQAADRLERWIGAESPEGVSSGRVSEPIGTKVAFVFPGQGAQKVSMGRELMRDCPVFRDAVDECDEALRRFLGRSVIDDLHRLPDDASLDRIHLIQPALFAISVGLAARCRSFGIEPDAVVGHSMGEVAAAYVAGVLTLEEAVQVIGTRSTLLDRLRGRGAMLVVGLPADEVERQLSGRRPEASVAVSNGPTSTVIAGTPGAIQDLTALFTARNVFCRPVRTLGASHCSLVDEVLDEMGQALTGLTPKPADIPMVSTVTGRFCEGTELDGPYWTRNMRQPVRFWEATRSLLHQGYGVFIELGPHPVLTAAVEQAFEAAEVDGLALAAMRNGEPERDAIPQIVGALHTRGISAPLARMSVGSLVSLPTYAWQRERLWFREVEGRPTPARSTSAGPPERAVTDAPKVTGAPPGRSEPGPDPGRPRDALRADTLRDTVLNAVTAVLEFPAERLDPAEGFFQLGMDSATATQVRARLEQALGVRMPTTLLFEHPTVDALALKLAEFTTTAEKNGTRAASETSADLADVAGETAAPVDTPLDDALDGMDEAMLRDLLQQELLQEELDVLPCHAHRKEQDADQ